MARVLNEILAIPAWQHSSRELSCSLPQPLSAKRMQTGERAASEGALGASAAVLPIGMLTSRFGVAGEHAK
jgi:hypothetical protein